MDSGNLPVFFLEALPINYLQHVSAVLHEPVVNTKRSVQYKLLMDDLSMHQGAHGQVQYQIHL